MVRTGLHSLALASTAPSAWPCSPALAADQREIRDIAQVEVALDRNRSLTLLFDPEHALDDRIAMEQFIV